MPRTDPDDILVVLFKHMAKKNEVKSLTEGRPIFDDIEICEIRAPGNKDVKVFPAHEFSRWVADAMTGDQVKQSYAERFSHQYRQFKASAAQTKTGTPLDQVSFLSAGRQSELRAQNIYTVEQLAAIEGAELKNLGPGGRDFKNQAEAYIAEGRAAAPNLQLQAELEALRARNSVLEEDNKLIADRRKVDAAQEAEFDEMTRTQLEEYITVNTGQAPIGSPSRKTLVRMASEARPQKVA
jgi:hypothetical protein